MKTIQMKDFKPLTNHQTGIKIRELVKLYIEETTDEILLDFSEIAVCTDSFSQQITTILANEITFSIFQKRVKFVNLNDFTKELIKSNLLKAFMKNEQNSK